MYGSLECRYCFMCGTVLTVGWSRAEPDVGIPYPYISEIYCETCGWEPPDELLTVQMDTGAGKEPA